MCLMSCLNGLNACDADFMNLFHSPISLPRSHSLMWTLATNLTIYFTGSYSSCPNDTVTHCLYRLLAFTKTISPLYIIQIFIGFLFYSLQPNAFVTDNVHQPITSSLIQSARSRLAVWVHSHHPAHFLLCITTIIERKHFTAPRHTVHNHTLTSQQQEKINRLNSI